MYAILSNDLVQSINELRDLEVLLVSVLCMKNHGLQQIKAQTMRSYENTKSSY